jgi:hypothetical protein
MRSRLRYARASMNDSAAIAEASPLTRFIVTSRPDAASKDDLLEKASWLKSPFSRRGVEAGAHHKIRLICRWCMPDSHKSADGWKAVLQ